MAAIKRKKGEEAQDEQKKGAKIPGWATRLPFGLCMRYGISLPENATPRDAWDALKGRGISRKTVYDGMRKNERSAENSNGAGHEQAQDGKKAVEAFMSNDRIRVSNQNKEFLRKCFESGTPEMQSTTSQLFIDDSYSYLAHNGNGQFDPKDNAVHMKYNKEDTPEATFYHESWHAIDYNYGEVSGDEIRAEFTRKGDELKELVLARKIHPSLFNKKLREYAEEARGKMYISSSFKLSSGETFKDVLLEETKGRGKELYEDASKRYNEDKEKLGAQEASKKWSDMSDIINGLTKAVFLSYHPSSYWDKAGNSRAHEAFAEIASSRATNRESYDIIKSYLPKTVEAYEELYAKLSKGEIPRRQT